MGFTGNGNENHTDETARAFYGTRKKNIFSDHVP